MDHLGLESLVRHTAAQVQDVGHPVLDLLQEVPAATVVLQIEQHLHGQEDEQQDHEDTRQRGDEAGTRLVGPPPYFPMLLT